jgi:hypothetical protein
MFENAEKSPYLNFINALLLLRTFTRARFDVYDLAGPSNGRARAIVFSALQGSKVPVSKSGVNALRDALHLECGIPQMDCLNSRNEWFSQIADFLTTRAGAL